MRRTRSASTSSTAPRGRACAACSTIVTGVALLAIYGVSLPAVTDYVAFMKVERTAYLKIPMNWLYFVYVIFAVAVAGPLRLAGVARAARPKRSVGRPGRGPRS